MAKTQAEINKRLNDYAKGIADSKFRITKPTSYDPAFGTMEKGAIDADDHFHAQCMDLIIDYVLWLTDNKFRTWGNAKDAIKNNFPEGFKIHTNKPSTIPKKGWIAVYTTGSYAQWGHIGIVFDGGNTSKFTILEQNFNGYANKKPLKRVDNYYGLTHFIEVPVKAGAPEKKVVKKETAKKETAKKAPKITVSKNRINYNMNKRGRNPKGVVIHNDAGSLSGKQWESNLVNAGQQRFFNGIAHAYASEGYVWEGIDDSRIAFHTGDGTGSNSGNVNYYGIEVVQSMSASDAQFLKNEQTTFQFIADKFKAWGLTPNRNSVRLHDEFTYTACPHRSYRLHTGVDPVTQGRPSQATRNKMKDYFIKQIKNHMNNGTSSSTVVKSNKTSSASTPATRPVSGGWKKNKHNTWYKAEKATFTCGNTAIATRIGSPFRSAKLGYWFQPGGYTNYDEICLQDGHLWIGYNWKGQRYYLPIRTWNGKAPGNGYSVGKMWGSVK